jgi:hypothetical protein
MSLRFRLVCTLPLLMACACGLAGCGEAQKTVPHMRYGDLSIEAQIARTDLTVLDRVEGSSTLTSLLLGAVQIVDGDKLQLLGIKFFKDKYTYFKNEGSWWADCVDRAYYKALEAAPEADFVFYKSMDHEDGGIPLLWTTKAVTVRGKAVKLKVDQ